VIVFSHANSFGAFTYNRLFALWRDAGHEVAAVEHFGHDPQYSVDKRWQGMTRQLTTLIDSLAPARVWLVGHSMGGYLSLLAAGQRPNRVRGIVVLDAPIIHGWKSGVVGMVKAVGQMPRVSPAAAALKRRDRWASLGEVRSHFAAKSIFARWHAGVLDDYVRHGTEPDPATGPTAALRLRFRPEIEASIYATVPHRLVPYLRAHPPGGPVAFLAGTRSREVRQVGLAATERLCQGRIGWIEGSHLFPFEQPEQTAAAVLDWLRRLEGLGGGAAAAA